MVDLEKVLKGLECCLPPHDPNCDLCPYDSIDLRCRSKLHEDVIALLKAQESAKPVVDIDTWKCENCGHTLEHQELLGDNVLFHEQYNFCPECGRKVKWYE